MVKTVAPLDYAFLRMESREAPSHVSGLQVFQIPDDQDPGDFMTRLKESLYTSGSIVPPFNWKLDRPHPTITWPHWVEDNRFDLEYHLRFSALPKPGTMGDLLKLVSRLHSRLLDRTRPLWEFYVIEGLEGNRFALYTKMHHALVDGMGAMALMEAIFANDPDDLSPRAPWLIGYDRAVKRAEGPKKKKSALRRIAGMLNSAIETAETLPDISRMLALPMLGLMETEMAPVFGAPRSMINTDISGARKFAITRMSLTEVKSLGKALGYTINDMVLAICAGGLRRYMEFHESLPDKSLTANVPVALKSVDTAQPGSQIGYLPISLATDIDHAKARIASIHASARDAKDEFTALSGHAARNLGIVENSLGVAMNQLKLGTLLPPAANLVISNVPGPKTTKYFMGAKLEATYPLSILIDGQALNITVVSYDGEMDFGLMACRKALPDVDRLSGFMQDALQELRDEIAAGNNKPAEQTTPKPRRRLSPRPTRKTADAKDAGTAESNQSKAENEAIKATPTKAAATKKPATRRTASPKRKPAA